MCLKDLGTTNKRVQRRFAQDITDANGPKLVQYFNQVQQILPFEFGIANSDFALTIADFDI